MNRYGIILAFLALFVLIAVPGEAADSRDAKIYLLVGYSVPFMDMEQFNNDLSDLNLADFSYPLGGSFGFGLDLFFGKHILVFYDHLEYYQITSHENGNYANLNFSQVLLHLGYGYKAADLISFRADIGVGSGNWQYTLITRGAGSFDGNAQGTYYCAQPTGGLMFHFMKDLIGLYLYGGYNFVFVKGGELYSGDWTGETFDELDFDYPFAGLDLQLRF